jgi:hypothetical protein
VLGQPGVRSEVGVEHLPALRVHHPRVGPTASQHLQHRRRVEPAPPGERQPFRQDRPVQAENQVHHELRPGPAPPRTDVMPLLGEQSKQWFGPADGVRGAAGRDDQRAGPGLAARPGQGRINVVTSFDREFGPEARRRFRVAGRRIDDQGSASEFAGLGHHIRNDRAIRQAEDDHANGREHVPDRR